MLFKEANTRYASQAWNPHQDNIYTQNNSKLSNGFTTQYLTTNFFLADAMLTMDRFMYIQVPINLAFLML